MGFQRFATTGTFVPPPGVTSVKVECWGGGGGGGAGTGNPAEGGGGAGGAYATKDAFAVTPGTAVTVTVAVATTASSGAGATGGTTWFSSNDTNGIVAVGGPGGALASTNSSNGNGGTGTTTGCFGTTLWAGGNGAAGVFSSSLAGGAGGAGGGSTAAGANGVGNTGGAGANGGGSGANGVADTTAGADGTAPGGGGSGGDANTATDQVGGKGARGEVLVTWEDPTDTGIIRKGSQTYVSASAGTAVSLDISGLDIDIAAGDIILVMLGANTAATVTNPTGFSSLRSSLDTTARFHMAINEPYLTTTSTTTLSLTLSTSSDWAAIVVVYGGVNVSYHAPGAGNRWSQVMDPQSLAEAGTDTTITTNATSVPYVMSGDFGAWVLAAFVVRIASPAGWTATLSSGASLTEIGDVVSSGATPINIALYDTGGPHVANYTKTLTTTGTSTSSAEKVACIMGLKPRVKQVSNAQRTGAVSSSAGTSGSITLPANAYYSNALANVHANAGASVCDGQLMMLHLANNTGAAFSNVPTDFKLIHSTTDGSLTMETYAKFAVASDNSRVVSFNIASSSDWVALVNHFLGVAYVGDPSVASSTAFAAMDDFTVTSEAGTDTTIAGASASTKDYAMRYTVLGQRSATLADSTAVSPDEQFTAHGGEFISSGVTPCFLEERFGIGPTATGSATWTWTTTSSAEKVLFVCTINPNLLPQQRPHRFMQAVNRAANY